MFAVKQMMANLMQGTCRGGVSAERRNIYIYTNNEKDMYLDIYIYIYGTPFAHEKGRLSRGGGYQIYIYIYITYVYLYPSNGGTPLE